MKIEYTVATATASDVPYETEIGGQMVTVQAKAAVVELVSTDGTMGHSFKFLTDVDAVLAEMTVGRTVILSLDPQ